MVHAQIGQYTHKRKQCVHCSRKRLTKFFYRIRLPLCFVVIEVCVDCFDKFSHNIQIVRSAEADSEGKK